jgi:hypothetical protein
LSDALNLAISMSLKLKKEMNHHLILDVLIDDDSSLDIKLGSLARNTKKEVCGVMGSFISFLTKYDERRAHNMLSSMLDPRFKNLKY